MSAKAFYSQAEGCWFVPMAPELFEDERETLVAEPVRIELKDGELIVTRLDPEDLRPALREVPVSTP